MNTRQHPTDRFEERLLTTLKQVVAERNALDSTPAGAEVAGRARWPRRKPHLAMTAAAAAVALGLTAVVVLPLGPGNGAAYAVTSLGDGKVRVEINHLSDADGLERNLEEAGIPAEVDYLPGGMYCREPRFTPVPGDSREMIGFEGEPDGSLAFTVDPADFQGDRTLVIVTSGPQEGPPTPGTEVMAIAAEGEVAPCEPVESPSSTPPHPPENLEGENS